MGQIYGENTDFTGDTQVRVTKTRHKYHRPRHEKILDGYYGFNNYFFVVLLRAATNF